jgi:hypothetical protein
MQNGLPRVARFLFAVWWQDGARPNQLQKIKTGRAARVACHAIIRAVIALSGVGAGVAASKQA